MCGIAGIFSKSKLLKASSLAPALSRLRHRGPDDEGYLVYDATAHRATSLGGDDTPAEPGLPHWRESLNVAGGIVIGHRRLSILDLSPRGHQPMAAADSSCWIVFNGEIYNYVELREELRELGHEFHTGTDTEVILHAWQQWGRQCLGRFNGDWAFCILDTRAGHPTLFLARDRYGVKPLFYAQNGDDFWFASEVKALVGHAVPFRPQEKAVIRFLLNGELPAGNGSDTFFQDISQVPPGGTITVSAAGVECQSWYDLRAVAEKQEPCDESCAVEQMAAHLDSAVRVRLRADVPVGSCLSGGVDSSSIVGTMRPILDAGGGGDLHTFSAVYHEKGSFNEIDWIKQVVAHNRSTSHYLYPDDAALADMFDRMVWHQDEPFQTASIFAQWCVMREARMNSVTVLLDGQAADELLGGYQPGSYQEQFLEWLQRGNYRRLVREFIRRKFATQLSWFTLIREFCQILSRGATGALWAGPDKLDMRRVLLFSALREEVAEQIYPSAPRPDPGEALAEKIEITAKLSEHQEKLARWKERMDYLRQKKRNHGPEWEKLSVQVAAKKEHISANQRKLAAVNAYLAAIESNAAKQTSVVSPTRWELMKEAFMRALSRIKGEPTHHLRDFLLLQTTRGSLPHLLRFEDRNSMAFSVEARVPFTDHRLVEWAFTHAQDFKIRHGWSKWVLRAAMNGRAPDGILWRRDKTGFETPDITMTRQLIEHGGRHPTRSEYLHRYLDPVRIAETCDRLKNGTATREDSRLVWRWLVLHSWHEQFEQAGIGLSPEIPA